MNASPRKHWQGFKGDPTHNPGCGFMAMENTVRAFWQSRHNLPDPPQLTDIRALASAVRASNEDAISA